MSRPLQFPSLRRSAADPPARRRLRVALVSLLALAGLSVPGVASAASLQLTVTPSDVTAGRPSEFRFDVEHTASSMLFTYAQPRTVACASKPSEQTFPPFDSIDVFSAGTDDSRSTKTYTTPQTLRICGYLQPRHDYVWQSREQEPLAAGSWDIDVRAPHATMNVAGIPPTVAPGGIFDVRLTTTTEVPREVAYRLVAGPACGPTPAGPSVFARNGLVMGGPAVWAERVDLSHAPNGLYTWCGYTGSDLAEGSVDAVIALSSVTVAPVPPPPPAPPTPPKTPARRTPSPVCGVITSSVRRGNTFTVRCHGITGSVRVRLRRHGKTITRTVRLKRGVARLPTARATPSGRWTVSVLGPTGKIGSGRMSIRRR